LTLAFAVLGISVHSFSVFALKATANLPANAVMAGLVPAAIPASLPQAAL
jgi:hypothetical protein